MSKVKNMWTIKKLNNKIKIVNLISKGSSQKRANVLDQANFNGQKNYPQDQKINFAWSIESPKAIILNNTKHLFEKAAFNSKTKIGKKETLHSGIVVTTRLVE